MIGFKIRKRRIKMPLKESVGNMYPWVTHTHTHLGGECSHKCKYCYVDNPIHGRPERYQGKVRLIEREFNVDYGEGKVIFIENCNDLFAADVPDSFIERIIDHCWDYPKNTYVLQTKNPERYLEWEGFDKKMWILGCTIETNRVIPDIGTAPTPEKRMEAMVKVNARKFITIEPVLDFDTDILAKWIADIKPEFLNLGADSKNHGLKEPSVKKVHNLVAKLKEYGIELREKHNLARLKK
jgi:DNA repair photolyase